MKEVCPQIPVFKNCMHCHKLVTSDDVTVLFMSPDTDVNLIHITCPHKDCGLTMLAYVTITPANMWNLKILPFELDEFEAMELMVGTRRVSVDDVIEVHKILFSTKKFYKRINVCVQEETLPLDR